MPHIGGVDCEACQKKGDEIGDNFEETRKDSISKSAIFFRNKKHKISTGVKCYEVGTYVKIIYIYLKIPIPCIPAQFQEIHVSYYDFV